MHVTAILVKMVEHAILRLTQPLIFVNANQYKFFLNTFITLQHIYQRNDRF